MFDIQLFCGCGYELRFNGEPPEAKPGREGLNCPMCSRSFLLTQGLLETHPVIRSLVGRNGTWTELTQSAALKPLELN